MDQGPAHPSPRVPTATTAARTPSPAPPRPPPCPAGRSFPPRSQSDDPGRRQPPSQQPDSRARSPEPAASLRARGCEPRRSPRPPQSAPLDHSPSAGALGGGRCGSENADPQAPTRGGAPTRSRPSLSGCGYKASLRPESWKSTSGGAGEGRVLAPELLPAGAAWASRGEGRRWDGAGRDGDSPFGRPSPSLAPKLVANPFCSAIACFPGLGASLTAPRVVFLLVFTVGNWGLESLHACAWTQTGAWRV